MDGDYPESEYLCTLQPQIGSELHTQLLECRKASQLKFGVDETCLYPPHVSVTGFFFASSRQVLAICEAIAERCKKLPSTGGKVNLRQVVQATSGHVLIDVVAPGFAELSAAAALEAKPLGVTVRSKAVRHISLASQRSADEQRQIAQLYGPISLGWHQMDLVVSRLLRRSTVELLQQDMQGHSFVDVLRLPLQSVQTAKTTAAVPLNDLGDASTPNRKRPGLQCNGEWRGNSLYTPPKLAKIECHSGSIELLHESSPSRCRQSCGGC